MSKLNINYLTLYLIEIICLISISVLGDDCTWSDPNTGTNFDISAISHNQGQDWQYTYSTAASFRFALCSNLYIPCQAPTVGALLSSYPTRSCHGLGTLSSAQYSLLGANENAGVQVQYVNGDSCSSSAAGYTVSHRIQCDPQGTSGTASIDSATIDPSNSCHFIINWKSFHGCPVEASESKGISGGWVFFIIVVVVTFIYVVGGCVYKRYHMGTTSFVESCPNIDFWREVPGLTRDGFMFTYQKIKSCVSSTTSSYQTVK